MQAPAGDFQPEFPGRGSGNAENATAGLILDVVTVDPGLFNQEDIPVVQVDDVGMKFRGGKHQANCYPQDLQTRGPFVLKASSMNSVWQL
jgi:hypothetical protein